MDTGAAERSAAVRREVHDYRADVRRFLGPVTAQTAAYPGQWYSENTMQGILAYRGQVTQALPGAAEQAGGNIGDKQALGWILR